MYSIGSLVTPVLLGVIDVVVGGDLLVVVDFVVVEVGPGIVVDCVVVGVVVVEVVFTVVVVGVVADVVVDVAICVVVVVGVDVLVPIVSL